jgi:hypothetical protein
VAEVEGVLEAGKDLVDVGFPDDAGSDLSDYVGVIVWGECVWSQWRVVPVIPGRVGVEVFLGCFVARKVHGLE